MDNIIFKSWPKIPRMENEEYNITEKIDGTNAAIVINEYGEIGAQSRKNLITPEKDNYGFAAWVHENKEELLKLGPGHHYGEWWGKGINRGYGLQERRFSLFSWWLGEIPSICTRVHLFPKEFTLFEVLELLTFNGSYVVPGFLDPEGIVIQSTHYNNALYKVLINKKNNRDK